jgi:hypothetical protein
MAENMHIIDGWTEKRGDSVRDVWRVQVGNEVKTLATRVSSTAALDEAMVIYERALKRLANR